MVPVGALFHLLICSIYIPLSAFRSVPLPPQISCSRPVLGSETRRIASNQPSLSQRGNSDPSENISASLRLSDDASLKSLLRFQTVLSSHQLAGVTAGLIFTPLFSFYLKTSQQEQRRQPKKNSFFRSNIVGTCREHAKE